MQFTNPTSEEIRTAITERSKNFLDVVVPFDTLMCEYTSNQENVEFKYDVGVANFSNHAFSQLLTRVQLSIHYWRRLSAWNAHQLMIDNFNFCNEATSNEITNQKRNNDPNYLFRLNPQTEIDLNNISDDDEDEDDDESTSKALLGGRKHFSSSSSNPLKSLTKPKAVLRPAASGFPFIKVDHMADQGGRISPLSDCSGGVRDRLGDITIGYIEADHTFSSDMAEI